MNDDLVKCIDDTKTAYSVDKVVEELEERSKEYNSCVRLHGKPEEMLTDEAIEIVKQGGVSDDVCEWQNDGDMAINPHNLSRYKIKQYGGLYALDTCQHCSKKIKVVE